jgi:hypothetical protein
MTISNANANATIEKTDFAEAKEHTDEFCNQKLKRRLNG